MNTAFLSKAQFWGLIGISALLVGLAPTVWHYSPDGGIYIGTAKSMVETGRYWFNGHPNLLYYPGLSSLLSVSIFLFGLNFKIMHLMCAAIVILCLWLARSYFPVSRFGIVGIAVPLMLLTARIFHRQAFSILSDGLFLALVLSALLLWRKYQETFVRKHLVVCCIVAAVAPLVRLEGLLLCAALGMALLVGLLRNRDNVLRSFLRLAAICTALLAPFALWTLRNWALHTPDTFNMVNSIFFGLHGLQLYVSEVSAVTADEPLWRFGVYRVLRFVYSLPRTFLTEEIATALPKYFWIVVVIGLCATGASRWFKEATILERAFVMLSLVFLFVLMFQQGGRSLYVVPRYWLSILPAMMVMIGFGLVALHGALEAGPFRYVVSAIAVVLVVLAVMSGATKIVQGAIKPAYFRTADQVLQNIAAYLDRNAAPGVAVAATDWGVTPLLLNRQSYLILNDSSHHLSLRRMLSYKTAYLVILEQKGVFTPAAYRMVETFPSIFTPVLEVTPNGPGPVASLYKINLSAIAFVLDLPVTEAGQDPRAKGSSGTVSVRHLSALIRSSMPILNSMRPAKICVPRKAVEGLVTADSTRATR